MLDVVVVAVIVAFFVAAALLVRMLGRVTEEASPEREPDFPDIAEVAADQRPGLLPDGRK
jgi:hypothetical protein